MKLLEFCVIKTNICNCLLVCVTGLKALSSSFRSIQSVTDEYK